MKYQSYQKKGLIITYYIDGKEMAKNKKFRKLLKERGIKSERLAERLGVSKRAVEYWISGRNRPSMLNVIAMAKLFDMTIESVYAIFKV